jgi:hypothetical protein
MKEISGSDQTALEYKYMFRNKVITISHPMKQGIFIRAFLLLLLLTGFYKLPAQETDIYSLLTERYVDRPINVHRGQLQVNTGYELSVLNRKFDTEGKAVNLAKDGSAAMQHLFPLDLRYGFLEYLQMSVGINYARTGIRERNIWIAGYDTELSIDELNEYKGPDNLKLELSFRAPLGLDFLDWALHGNISLPIFDPKPEQPDHNISTPFSSTTQISYYYRNKFGSGIMTGALGTELKINTSNVSIFLSGSFTYPLKEGTNIQWRSNLIGNEFEYYTIEFNYKCGKQIEYLALFTYQAIDWLAIQLFINGTNTYGGWSDVTGKKVGYKPENLIAGGLGYEIMVSPHLRLFQAIDVPIDGKNIMGLFVVHTGISLNFISESYYNIF